jgi:hypothetical protein
MTLRRLDVWNKQVTETELYKNAYGTHRAVTTLLGDDATRVVIAQGGLALKRFDRTVRNDLLLPFEPTTTRDDDLWNTFKDRLRIHLDLTSGKEEMGLFGALVQNERQPGKPVFLFAMESSLLH